MDTETQIGLGANLTHEILVDYIDAYDDHFKGKIVIRRPNMQDYLKMGALKASYLKQAVGKDPTTKETIYADPNFIDHTIKMMAQFISTFKVLVVKCPKWFDEPEKLNDFGLLDHIYFEYEVWLNSFRKSSKDGSKTNSKKSSTEDAVVDSETL